MRVIDRQILYPGAIQLASDLLNIQRSAMITDGFLARAMFGDGTVAHGLACGPTSPVSMQVEVAPGMIASLQSVDATDFSVLAADPDTALVKVGVNLTKTIFTLTAPATSGHSINYLIQAAFSESDTTPVVLPYYNAANPTEAYSGPNNTGASQNTRRVQRVSLTMKAGTSAATGSQATPAVDAGNVALHVITVANGATTVTSGNVATAAGAPLVGGGALMPGRLIGVQRWTAAGAATYVPAPGTNSVIFEVKGGGASAGGAAATAAGQLAAGSGGGSGSFVRHRATSGFAGAAIVVGAGGAAPAAGANNGTNGGPSSVTGSGFTLSAPGGLGGLGGPARAFSFIVGPGASGATGAGGNLLNATGDSGGPGQGITDGTNFFLVSGDGGSGLEGGDAHSIGSGAGVDGGSPGAGGSGGASGGSGAGGGAAAGGKGADGIVIAYEYS